MQERTQAFEAGLEAALVDGKTTRQELVLRFGTPSAAFEGQRILTFDFVMDPAGTWVRVGARVTSDWLYPFPSTCSLVVVFDPEGILLRHRLVSRVEPSPSPTPAKGPE